MITKPKIFKLIFQKKLLRLSSVLKLHARRFFILANIFVGVAALSIANAANCISAPAGIVSWFSAESNALDTVGANNGTLENGTGFSAGEVGNSFNLDGVNDFVLVTASSGLNIGSGSGFTIEGWINPTTVAHSMAITEYERALGTFSGADVGVQFYVSSGGGPGALAANIKDTSGGDHAFNSSAGLVVAGAWQHVALTYDQASGTARIYRNGALVSLSFLDSFTPETSFNYLLFGARTTFNSVSSPSENFSGKMDEMSLYNRALSDSEIQSVFNAAGAGKCGAPQIVVQPRGQLGFWGKPLTLNVVAEGAEPLFYQWQKDGTELLGVTNSALSFASLDLTNAGSYMVVVTNFVGSITSSPAILTINPAGVSIALYPGVRIDGVVGLTYGIQSNSNLANVSGWMGITNLTLTEPVEIWYDSQPASLKQLFYRVLPGPISIP